MNKSVIATIGLIILACVAVYYFVSNSTADQEPATQTYEPEAREPVVYNDLPNMQLTRPDGSQFIANTLPGKTILIFFLPDCDHCQRETEEISKNLAAFQDYSLYFISEASMPQILQFGEKYKLAGKPNIQFAQTTLSELMKTLGSFSLPSVYIYGPDRRLKKSFKGETTISAILGAL